MCASSTRLLIRVLMFWFHFSRASFCTYGMKGISSSFVVAFRLDPVHFLAAQAGFIAFFSLSHRHGTKWALSCEVGGRQHLRFRYGFFIPRFLAGGGDLPLLTPPALSSSP